MKLELNNRQQQVLWATVRHYVATAKPVGSGALIDEFNLNVSSATIRNAMGRLEKAGLLYQPHTSAGRVPSDSGYRIYVDHLIQPSDTIARQVDQLLSDQLSWESCSFEALLRHAAQLLSSISGYITLVTMPQSRTACLRHIQLVQVDTRRIMLVVVLDCYETQSALITLPQDGDDSIDPESLDRELQILSNFLTQHLRGRSLGDLSNLDWSELGREFEQYANLLQSSLTALTQRSQTPIPTQLLVSGVAEVLRRQPEFSELQQVQTLIQLLEEEQEQLWPLIFETTDPQSQQRVVVRIGSENPIKPMNACALVSATYQRDNVPVGSVGMLGPTRMVYEDAIALVEAAAGYLSDVMSQAS
jgi:heat-inducible transcriptional repressor